MKNLVLAFVLIASLTGGTAIPVIAAQPEDTGVVSLVVIDPPADLPEAALALGFLLGERSELAELAMTSQVLQAPRGYTEAEARATLSNLFPNLSFDFDELAWSY